MQYYQTEHEGSALLREQFSYTRTPSGVWQMGYLRSDNNSVHALNVDTPHGVFGLAEHLIQGVWALSNQLLDVRSTVLSGELGAVTLHGHTVLVDQELLVQAQHIPRAIAVSC